MFPFSNFPSIYVYLGQIYNCKIGICHTIVRQETTENLVGIVPTLFPWTLHPTWFPIAKCCHLFIVSKLLLKSEDSNTVRIKHWGQSGVCGNPNYTKMVEFEDGLRTGVIHRGCIKPRIIPSWVVGWFWCGCSGVGTFSIFVQTSKCLYEFLNLTKCVYDRIFSVLCPDQSASPYMFLRPWVVIWTSIRPNSSLLGLTHHWYCITTVKYVVFGPAKEIGMFVLFPGLTWKGVFPSAVAPDVRQNP